MEAKINIAEILKDKPQGTKLYSPIFGNLRYEDLVPDFGEFTVVTSDNTSAKHSFRSDGRYNRHGEPLMLLPSKEMRDWCKFSWKKGDVLVSNDGKIEVIFEKFRSDTYQSFIGKHHLDSIDEHIHYQGEGEYCTFNFNIETQDATQTYINTIEARLGGKLNRETLEIEKSQPEFKDGDILLYKSANFTYFSSIFILGTNRNGMCSYVRFSIGKGSIDYDVPVYNLNADRFRYATEEEKQQLFDALAKEGKAWDAEKKQIVDLKQKWIPKPFDRVITRNAADDIWTANIFSHMDSHGEYVTIACVGGYTHCLPYNDETAKLIGTTNNWKG